MKKIVVLLVFTFFIFFTKEAHASISFEITNPQVNNDEVTFYAKISGLDVGSCKDGKCYLQGGFQKDSGDAYFGLTKNNSGQWIGYVSTPNENTPVEFITNNFLYCQISGENCETDVSMKFNYDDKKYKGPGIYNIRLQIYIGNSNGPAGDTSIQVTLNVATPSPTATATPTATPTSTSTPTVTAAPTPTATHKVSASMGGSSSTNTPKPSATVTSSPVSSPGSTPIPTILGIGSGSNNSGDGTGSSGNSVPTVAILFVASGVVIMAIAGVSILQARYNRSVTKSASS